MPDTAVTTLAGLLRHAEWATQLVLDAAAACDDAALDRPAEMGPGSLRATLAHLWAAERLWLDRWRGAGPAALPVPDDASVDGLRAAYAALIEERRAFLDGDGGDGHRRIAWTSIRGTDHRLPLGDLVLHVTNHAAHHRAQALNMLRAAGAPLESGTDVLHWVLHREEPVTIAYEPDTIGEYLHYGDWAFARVLAVARDLDDAALDRRFDMGLGTLRRTLLHVLDAEAWWTGNWNGVERPWENLDETTTLEAVAAMAAEVAARRDAFLDRCDAADLERSIEVQVEPGLRLAFAIGDSMLELGPHGTHHRAQAINMLRRLGVSVPPVDALVYALGG